VRLSIFNLYSEDIGNPALPERFRRPNEDKPRAVAPPAQVSVAVLPFTDMSAAKDQEYLCEGMAEEIMNALVRIDGIRVASRTSAFRAGKSGDALAAISRALSVGHVLEGSVRTAGVRLRVTAQLTDAASGYQLWSERFDREAIDVFAIQDEIAAGIVDAVKARLTPGSRTVHARAQAHDLEAYRSYLKGRHLRGVEDFGGALAAFEEAVRLDPAHAPSWTGLAEITVLSAHMGMIMPRATCTAARRSSHSSNAGGTPWKRHGAVRSSFSPITSSPWALSRSPSARFTGSMRRCRFSSARVKPIRSHRFPTPSPDGGWWRAGSRRKLYGLSRTR
jgi:TolB-like protein